MLQLTCLLIRCGNLAKQNSDSADSLEQFFTVKTGRLTFAMTEELKAV